jgi:hypothetical protein
MNSNLLYAPRCLLVTPDYSHQRPCLLQDDCHWHHPEAPGGKSLFSNTFNRIQTNCIAAAVSETVTILRNLPGQLFPMETDRNL